MLEELFWKILNKINTGQITYNLSNLLKLPKQIKNLKQWKHMNTHRYTLNGRNLLLSNYDSQCICWWYAQFGFGLIGCW